MTRPSNDLELVAGGQAIEATLAKPAPAADGSAGTLELARSDHASAEAASADDFRVRWRGYDRGEVAKYRSRMERDLANTRIAYRRAVRVQAQFGELFRAMESDLARLRGEVANSPSGLSERLREILQLAARDAEDTRSAAQADARQKQAEVQAEADRVRADAQQILKEAREAAADILGRARAEQQKVRAELEQETATVRKQLADAIAEGEQARERADATAAARRDEADRHAREQRDHANAVAAARLRETTEQLAELNRLRDEAVAALSVLRKRLYDVLNPPNITETPQPTSLP